MVPSPKSPRRPTEDLIPWSDEYRVGVRVIDIDHKNLFEIVNTLHAGILRGFSGRELDIAIAGLARYVDEHFEREENLMKEYHYPDLAEHREVHRNLIRTVYAIKKVRTEQPTMIDMEKLMAFLGDWLVNHIVKADSQYVPYLRGEVTVAAGGHESTPVQGASHGSVESHEELTEVTVLVPVQYATVLKRCALLMRRGGNEVQAIINMTDPIGNMTLDEAKEICASVLK